MNIHFGSCYKERVPSAEEQFLAVMPANAAKAPEGTACPASAKIDLCTISFVMV